MNNLAHDINDAFAQLELTPGANLSQIKRAYHRLAREYHPDLHHGSLGEAMSRINRAYRTLAEHIASSDSQRSPGSASTYNYSDFSSHRRTSPTTGWAGYRDFYRAAEKVAQQAAQRAARQERSRAQQAQAQASEAQPQPSPQAPAHTQAKTPAAPAAPAAPNRWRITGLDATGENLVYTVQVSGRPGSMELPVRQVHECTACAGSGRAPGGALRCPVCGGRGRLTRSDKVAVELPPNWVAGQVIEAPGHEAIKVVLTQWQGEEA